jgi:hypothetical protein
MNRGNQRRVKLLVFAISWSFFAGTLVWGQQANELVIRNTTLPKAIVRQPYRMQLQADGGTAPLKWEISEGALPAGVVLEVGGNLTGTPTETGEFRFTATVTDSGKPAYEKRQQFSLVVVSPLMLQWERYPKISGQRLEGSVLVSNQTGRDFDLTVIVLAVNEIGRATAIGYQHFVLKKNTEGVEIPFGDNLSRGGYQLNVDAVAEVAVTDSIYRARLVTKEKFHVEVGP